MAEVLDMVAAVEDRSPFDVLRDVRQTQADTLRLRFDGAALREGRVTVEGGAELFRSARDLLLAGACVAVEKRPVFARRKPDQAMRFLRHARFAPPESGSFVVVVESPVVPLLQGDLFADDLEPPFERRAMRALAVGLDAVKRAAEQASMSQEMDPFVRAVEDGVTANLCEAIVGLLGCAEGCGLSARFGWSRNRPAPRPAPPTIRIAPDIVPLLQSVAREFRTREPVSGFELRGPILELASKDPSEGGSVTVGGAIDNRVVRVRVDVKAADYTRAIQAHKDKLEMALEGELRREGRSYVLRNPRNLAILSDD